MLNRRRPDRGSVLMLMPAAILVVVVLGAITVDLTAVRLGQRELIGAAADAANDAVTLGIDERALRAGEGFRLDPARARRAVLDSLAAKGLLDALAAPPEVRVAADGGVEVRLTREVPHVFGRALPGVAPTTTVHGTAAARVERR